MTSHSAAAFIAKLISVFVIIVLILLMQIEKPNKPFRVTEAGFVSAPVLVNSRKLRAIGKEGREYREGVVRRTCESGFSCGQSEAGQLDGLPYLGRPNVASCAIQLKAIFGRQCLHSGILLRNH
jgi:hypothetical protein